MASIVFLGDLCGESGPPSMGADLRSQVELADAACVNLEGALVSENIVGPPKVGPRLQQADSMRDWLQESGFTHVNLANNHIMDFGAAGLQQTLRTLNGIESFGAGMCADHAFKPRYLTLDGVRIALLGFGEAQFGCLDGDVDSVAGFAWVGGIRARNAISEAKASADHVIVQVHAGLESEALPLPEWRRTYREFIDLGVDLVVGHHPHVLQGAEQHGHGWIFYSLGNFYVDRMGKEATDGALLKVVVNSDGIRPVLHCLKLSEGIVELDHSRIAQERVRRLCGWLTDTQNYQQRVDAMCMRYWKTVYTRYYEIAVNGVGLVPTVRGFLGWVMRLLAWPWARRRRERRNRLLLLHNLQIETHRWVVQRALRIAEVNAGKTGEQIKADFGR